MKFAYLRWMVRCAVLWIVAGTVFGLFMMAGYRVEELAWTIAWRSAHAHALLVGGVIQMIVGVALWMFPRPPAEPQWPKAWQGWTLWTLLNVGTLFRSIAGGAMRDDDTAFAVAFGGGVMQAMGMLAFVVLVLPRIRGPRPLRP